MVGCIGRPLHGDEGKKRVGIIFGGSFEGFEVVGPLDGAKTTMMAAFYEWDYGVRPFTKKRWEEQGRSWDQFFPEARALADQIAEKVTPKLVRDHREVVQYAVVADEDPFLTSTILSPKLYEKLRDTLGDRLYVVLVERDHFYVFPATGGALEDFAPVLLEEYQRARLPVSLEILLLDGSKISVVGALERSRSKQMLGPIEERTETTPAPQSVGP